MNQTQKQTLKVVYGGQLEVISYKTGSTYDEIIDIVIENLDIPSDFKNYLQISNGYKYIFTRETLEYFLVLFPTPQVLFHIRVDYKALMSSLKVDARKPLSKVSNKRKLFDEYGYARVTRQNCFIGAYPGMNRSEEPLSKRCKIERIRFRCPLAAEKKLSTRKTLRI